MKKIILGWSFAFCLSFFKLYGQDFSIKADVEISENIQELNMDFLKDKEILIVIKDKEVPQDIHTSPTFTNQVTYVVKEHVLPWTCILIMAFLNSELEMKMDGLSH